MEEAAENSKELSHSAHANEWMNEYWTFIFLHSLIILSQNMYLWLKYKLCFNGNLLVYVQQHSGMNNIKVQPTDKRTLHVKYMLTFWRQSAGYFF